MKQAHDEIWTFKEMVKFVKPDHHLNKYGFFVGAVIIDGEISLYSLN